MARAAAKKKKKEQTEFARIMKKIWTEVDKAVETGKDFSLDQVMAYEKLGTHAKKEREKKGQLIKELRPRKDLRTMVAKKAREKERKLSLHVTPKAVRSAIYLAEMFENAKRPEDLRFKKWMKEEAMT